MVPLRIRKLENDREIRFGIASWSKTEDLKYSVKFCWPDSLGRTSRGGEVPLNTLPGMMVMALESGHLLAEDIAADDREALLRLLA